MRPVCFLRLESVHYSGSSPFLPQGTTGRCTPFHTVPLTVATIFLPLSLSLLTVHSSLSCLLSFFFPTSLYFFHFFADFSSLQLQSLNYVPDCARFIIDFYYIIYYLFCNNPTSFSIQDEWCSVMKLINIELVHDQLLQCNLVFTTSFYLWRNAL